MRMKLNFGELELNTERYRKTISAAELMEARIDEEMRKQNADDPEKTPNENSHAMISES